MTLPLVTIGIPTFNRANRYLRETLESALAQTYPNLDIVVADNCSPDDTTAVVRSYNDPRVRYFRHEPGMKPNDNFNFCLHEARGDYFLLLHDDDKIDPDFVETCINALSENKMAGVIRTGHRIIDPNSRVIRERINRAGGLAAGAFFLGWFRRLTSFYLCATLYETRGLREAGGFKSRHNLYQDVMATVRVAAARGRVDIEAPKASARQHMGKGGYAVHIGQWAEDALELLDLLCSLAPENRDELLAEGKPYFANVVYRRASRIRSPIERFKAYSVVYRFFGRRFLPSIKMLFQSTSMYRTLRKLKRKALGLPAWVE